MTAKHLALIVEDDPAMAEELAEILRALDCESLTVDNKADALEAVRTNTFCFILLDLQIKSDRGAIKGHTANGEVVLQEVRKRYPDHNGAVFQLPILIVSGFARERDAALTVMRSGATDVFEKMSLTALPEGIRSHLARSGRTTHEACKALRPSRLPVDGAPLEVAVPATPVQRRFIVTLGGRAAHLTPVSLRVLLHLVVAKREGRMVHKVELGATADEGFKGISNLKSALKMALGEGIDVIGNDYHGNYFLKENTTIGECHVGNLLAIGDTAIAALASKLKHSGDAVVEEKV